MMRTYAVTVSGEAYAITIEEGVTAGAAPAATTPVAAPAPAAAPMAVPASAAVPTGATDSAQVVTPVPGEVVAVKNAVGQVVKRGDIILVLEAMRMESDIVAP